MTQIKLLTVVGTRPEAIKLAPLILRLREAEGIRHKVIGSGQHRELLRAGLAMFGIEPDLNLELMQANQTLPELTSRALLALDAVCRSESPDCVVVQGDTTTALAAALAAFYNRVPLAHVEAGLRTDNVFSPFPEEVNRRFIDRLASLHFAPTETARQNLLRDGIDDASVFVTGNTGIDALLHVARKTIELPPSIAHVKSQRKKLVLVTSHRRENFGAPLANICRALCRLVERNPEIVIVYPVHPNPNVQRTTQGMLAHLDRIHLIPPLDYISFVALMKSCELILTDSGGIQEEAPSLGKPVLVLRASTERTEAIQAGTAVLVGTEPEKIISTAEYLLDNKDAYGQMVGVPNPYGDGRAAERIVAITLDRVSRKLPSQAAYVGPSKEIVEPAKMATSLSQFMAR